MMTTRDLESVEFHDAEILGTVIRRDADQNLDVSYSLVLWAGAKEDGQAITLRVCNCYEVRIGMHAYRVGPDLIDSVADLGQSEALAEFCAHFPGEWGSGLFDHCRHYQIVFHCGGVADFFATHAEVESAECG